jgi:hypothetical protein
MTTHDTIPAPTPVTPPAAVAASNTATHPTVGPVAPARALAPLELLNACINEAGLEGSDLEHLKVVAKVVIGEESIWESGKSPPGRDDLYVVVLFEGSQADLNDSHTPGDARAYVCPAATSLVSPLSKMWLCYTLSRAQPSTLSASIMTEARFIEEVSAEFTALAGVRDSVFDDNQTLREALEKVLSIVGETTSPAMTRLANVQGVVRTALEEVDGDNDEEEEEA